MKTRMLNWNEVIAIDLGFARPAGGVQVSRRYAGTMTLIRMREIKRIRTWSAVQNLKLRKGGIADAEAVTELANP